MGLSNGDESKSYCFVDLGSGVGRLTAQAWLELPRVEKAIGVELAPTRHASAVRAWDAARASPMLHQVQCSIKGLCDPDAADGGPEYRLGSMLDADLSSATHIYVSSLCMSDGLLDQLWAYLTRKGVAPRLETVATLRQFPEAAASPAVDCHSLVEVEMSWNRRAGSRTPVYVYQMRQ